MYKQLLHLVIVLRWGLLCILIASSSSFAQSFVKVNSKTRSDIKRLVVTPQNECLFLTDKIYSFNKGQWSKIELPGTNKTFTFYPVSSKNIWYCSTLETSISQLYHYHDGVIENLNPPFANHITGIYFANKDLGFFTSISDVAIYSKGKFKNISPASTRYSLLKIWGETDSAFYALSLDGSLFKYQDGAYKRLFANDKVLDFQFFDFEHGLILFKDRIVEIIGNQQETIFTGEILDAASRFYAWNRNDILLVGLKGLLLRYHNGIMRELVAQCTEDLTDIAVTTENEIWISGQNGRLLYSGGKSIAAYEDTDLGFSSHQLISYGINTDDEYGIGIADVTGDRKPDIYSVCIFSPNRLYVNQMIDKNTISSFSRFSEEGAERNATGALPSEAKTTLTDLKLGISLADVDNDGDQDIYLCYLNSYNRLLLNNGKGEFRNVSKQQNRACENMNRSNSSAFADIDLDGDLDLFIANEEGSNRLFENDGTGHFKDITAGSGLQTLNGGMCASFSDINNDGYPDLAVSFWYPSNKIYLNETRKNIIHFRDITASTDLAKAEPTKSNAIVFADVNNDGSSDLFIANRNAANKLYLNNGQGVFKDRSADYFGTGVFLSNGAVFADFDLDGFQDLYIANVGDCILYKNIGGKHFENATADFGAELSGYCTGCATGDVDNDGDVDLYVGNYTGGSSKLFLNISGKKSFAKITLRGTVSNRDAVGAKIWLFLRSNNPRGDSLAGYREITAGAGYCSVSDKEAIFGINPSGLYYAKIKFPSSSDTLIIDPIRAGDILLISEEKGIEAIMSKAKRSVFGFVGDNENQPEIIKYVLMLGLILIFLVKFRSTERLIFVIQWAGSLLIFLLFILINYSLLFTWPSYTYYIAPLITTGLMSILYLGIGRYLMHKQSKREKQELREKLSRDLHDDLASTLGSISIYSNTLGNAMNLPQAELPRLSAKIAGLSQNAMQSISDIIWMTSPRNDSLQSLVTKIHVYLSEVLADNGIECQMKLAVPEKEIVLPEKIRNNLYLIVKESLHNVIKHSGAHSLVFEARATDDRYSFFIADDGQGFEWNQDIQEKIKGNGLRNMQQRAIESGLNFELQSEIGKGTQITIDFEI